MVSVEPVRHEDDDKNQSQGHAIISPSEMIISPIEMALSPIISLCDRSQHAVCAAIMKTVP